MAIRKFRSIPGQKAGRGLFMKEGFDRENETAGRLNRPNLLVIDEFR